MGQRWSRLLRSLPRVGDRDSQRYKQRSKKKQFRGGFHLHFLPRALIGPGNIIRASRRAFGSIWRRNLHLRNRATAPRRCGCSPETSSPLRTAGDKELRSGFLLCRLVTCPLMITADRQRHWQQRPGTAADAQFAVCILVPLPIQSANYSSQHSPPPQVVP